MFKPVRGRRWPILNVQRMMTSMNTYRVRIYKSGISLNDCYEDYTLESKESLAAFVERLSTKGSWTSPSSAGLCPQPACGLNRSEYTPLFLTAGQQRSHLTIAGDAADDLARHYAGCATGYWKIAEW